MIALIVDQEDLNPHPVMDDGLQFLKIHLNTAITGQKDHIAASVILTCLPGADRCWKIVTHGRNCGIGDKPLALLDGVAMASRHAGRAISHYSDLVFFQSRT